jgi:hypothetical protein
MSAGIEGLYPMNYALIFIPPLVNVIVTGLFAGVVVRQYLRRRRQYQLFWSLALVMAFLATVAYICMLIVQPTSIAGMLFFRCYYLFGASIMPAWLGLGSLALAGWKRLTRILLGIITFLSFISLAFIFDATIDTAQLAHIAGTPGTGTLQPGPWLIIIIVLNTFGVVAVAGVALYSGWKLLRRQANIAGIKTSTILWANACICAGVIVIALAGSLARIFGLESTFWLIMALGWIILFGGVLLTGHRSRASISTTVPDVAPTIQAEASTPDISSSQNDIPQTTAIINARDFQPMLVAPVANGNGEKQTSPIYQEQKREQAFREQDNETIAALEQRVAELERFCGQLALENDQLKKTLRRLQSTRDAS